MKPLAPEQILAAIGQRLEANLKESARQAGIPDIDNSRLVKSVALDRVSVLDEQVDVVLNQYFRFVELGRRKGARLPPVEPILDWMYRYRVAPGRELEVVWAIRKKISRDGIRPRPFVSRGLSLTEKEAEEILQAQLQFYIRSLTI